MVRSRLVWCGEELRHNPIADVGGKGHNLLRLYNWARKSERVEVPEFFIVPVNYSRNFIIGERNSMNYPTNEVKLAFEKIGNPDVVRSSSVLEDGNQASFAGMFLSLKGINSYEGLSDALYQVHISPSQQKVRAYAERMGVEFSRDIAMIVQKEVTDFALRGTVQLGKDSADYSTIYPGGETFPMHTEFSFLDEHGPWGVFDKPHDFISASEEYNLVQCARDAAKGLKMKGDVQVEYLLAPGRKPFFVQIRQLSKATSSVDVPTLDVPRGVPCLESQVCNGIAGDLSLPAYVTCSRAGIGRILIETGLMLASEESVEWLSKSKLSMNEDFQAMNNFNTGLRLVGFEERGQGLLRAHENVWRQGNSLFSEYLLVCDKLDNEIVDMSGATPNKKGIITCLEADKTSHAMTVARDLGIPAMGAAGDIMDLESFYNQVQTGDTVRMKSDGKRAVAYVEKKRERDPYSI
ncbi:MAG: PEP/pyruvate-binding domain-containing protein [archaeon]